MMAKDVLKCISLKQHKIVVLPELNWIIRWEKRQKESERFWPVSVDTLLPPEPQSTGEEEIQGQFMDIEIVMWDWLTDCVWVTSISWGAKARFTVWPHKLQEPFAVPSCTMSIFFTFPGLPLEKEKLLAGEWWSITLHVTLLTGSRGGWSARSWWVWDSSTAWGSGRVNSKLWDARSLLRGGNHYCFQLGTAASEHCLATQYWRPAGQKRGYFWAWWFNSGN